MQEAPQMAHGADSMTIAAAPAATRFAQKAGPLNEGGEHRSPPWKHELQQIVRVESPTCTPTVAMSAGDWRPGRPGDSAGPSCVPPMEPLPAQPAAPAPQAEVPKAEEWVPLSVRQAQAREKEEGEARERKMAKILAPITLDGDTGLPCIPERCLPIKLYQRWLDASAAREKEVERRRAAARSLANKVMAGLSASSALKTFDSYCEQLAALSVSSGEPAANMAHSGGSVSEEVGTVANSIHDGAKDVPAPMLKRSNSWELLSNSQD